MSRWIRGATTVTRSSPAPTVSLPPSSRHQGHGIIAAPRIERVIQPLDADRQMVGPSAAMNAVRDSRRQGQPMVALAQIDPVHEDG